MRQQHLNLLCIDDDLDGLKVRKVLLETFGFRVTTAGGGRKGLRAFKTHDYDAVVLDYQMPEMDGAAVAREIKRLRPQVPVMILSALPWLPDEAPKECIDEFAVKGEPTPQLVRKIEAMVAKAPRPEQTLRRRWSRSLAMTGAAVGVAVEQVRELAGKKPHKAMARVAQAHS